MYTTRKLGLAGAGRFLIVLFLLVSSAFAQNGRLMDASSLTLKPSDEPQSVLRDILNHVEIRAITYLSDNLKVKGYLAVPKNGDKLPCLIFNRGGNQSFSAFDDRSAVLQLGNMARWGYVVAASQYRGNAGGEGKEEFGGADIDDVLNLIPLLEAIPQADPSRIGMYGWSRGGMMTYLALAKTDRITAAIIGGGMADSFNMIAQRPDMENVYAELVPGYRENKAAVLTARSAILWPKKLHKKTPILLLHGGADWRVPPSQAFAMAEALYKSKHPFRFVFFEGGDHGLSEHQQEVNRLAQSWLDQYVRDKKSWPSLEPHGK